MSRNFKKIYKFRSPSFGGKIIYLTQNYLFSPQNITMIKNIKPFLPVFILTFIFFIYKFFVTQWSICSIYNEEYNCMNGIWIYTWQLLCEYNTKQSDYIICDYIPFSLFLVILILVVTIFILLSKKKMKI